MSDRFKKIPRANHKPSSHSGAIRVTPIHRVVPLYYENIYLFVFIVFVYRKSDFQRVPNVGSQFACLQMGKQTDAATDRQSCSASTLGSVVISKGGDLASPTKP